MNFPFVSLDSYISLDDRKPGIKAFMGDLKKWLQSQKLTFAWLAENMLKSEGTVKNWFYSGLNIDDEKLERILYLCKAHLDGVEGVAYPQEADARAMSYIHLKPYSREQGVENDLAGAYISVGKSWSMVSRRWGARRYPCRNEI